MGHQYGKYSLMFIKLNLMFIKFASNDKSLLKKITILRELAGDTNTQQVVNCNVLYLAHKWLKLILMTF